MVGYQISWSDVPRQQYEQLAPDIRAHIDAALDDLVADPQRAGSYDHVADQWTAIFGDGNGLILYVVNPSTQRVVLLRIATM